MGEKPTKISKVNSISLAFGYLTLGINSGDFPLGDFRLWAAY
jgi:hypothetical protein